MFILLKWNTVYVMYISCEPFNCNEEFAYLNPTLFIALQEN